MRHSKLGEARPGTDKNKLMYSRKGILSLLVLADAPYANVVLQKSDIMLQIGAYNSMNVGIIKAKAPMQSC